MESSRVTRAGDYEYLRVCTFGKTYRQGTRQSGDAKKGGEFSHVYIGFLIRHQANNATFIEVFELGTNASRIGRNESSSSTSPLLLDQFIDHGAMIGSEHVYQTEATTEEVIEDLPIAEMWHYQNRTTPFALTLVDEVDPFDFCEDIPAFVSPDGWRL